MLPWLVYWDLPYDNPVNRVRHYRKLKKLKKNINEEQIKFEGQSILIVNDRMFATSIMDLAKNHQATRYGLHQLGEIKIVKEYEKPKTEVGKKGLIGK